MTYIVTCRHHVAHKDCPWAECQQILALTEQLAKAKQAERLLGNEMKTFFAWHFTADKLRVGMWEHYEGKLELYKSGLHWSRDPFDALQHAPGANLRRVEIKGNVLEQSNKGCSHYRRTVYQFDATELLRYFARMQALSIIHLYPNGTDDVVFDYLMTGDKSLRAAARAAVRDAAWAAAGAAVRAAAGDAAWAAARDAVRDAAWAGARAAARVAARAAAQAAAGDAARAAAGDAAGDAAWAAARAAAWAGARKDFNKLIEDENRTNTSNWEDV